MSQERRRASSPHLRAAEMRARLYVGVAGLDTGFPAEEGGRLVTALSAAGRNFAFEVYAGARHGFAVSGSPVYDAVHAERHWARLASYLGPAPS